MKTLKQIIKQDCFFVPTFAKSEVGIPIPQSGHRDSYVFMFSCFFPSALFRRRKASKVALTLLILLFVPKILATALETPAKSKITRTAPPAIMPVPLGAGLIKILAAPYLMSTR